MAHASYRLTIVGPGGVGKSAATVRYIQNKFVDKHDPTIEDSYVKHVEIDGNACELDIMDTAGQEEYSALRDSHMQTGDGFIIMYSIANQQSFEQVEKFHHKILRLRPENLDFPILIVGNKKDIEERAVGTEQGQELAHKLKATFIETSAKTGENVNEAFNVIVKQVNAYRKLHPAVKQHKRKGFKCTIL